MEMLEFCKDAYSQETFGHVLNDNNIRELVRSKVLGIIKPLFRQMIAGGAQESSVGIFGCCEEVINRLTEHKKINQAFWGTFLLTKKNSK